MGRPKGSKNKPRVGGVNMRYAGIGNNAAKKAKIAPKPPPAPPEPPPPKAEPVKRPLGRPVGSGKLSDRYGSPLKGSPGGIDPTTAAMLAVMRVKNQTNYGAASITRDILALLPIPHPSQLIVEQSPAKRKVVVAGRRGGKTTEAARVAIIKATEGRRVLLASTTQDQADAFWEKCKEWLSDFIASGEIEKNETRRILSFPMSGGRIKVKTASDADTLRGDYADFLVLDECALLAPNAWDEVGAPMLLDNDGDCWFLSTPRHRNWFYRLYQRAEGDLSGRWAKFHFTSFGNPHLSEEALKEITEDLSDEAYRQEILAEFLPGEGAVFRNIMPNMHAPRDSDPETHRGHFVVMGVDWAQKRDYTCFSIFCVTCKTELELVRFNQVEWQVQRSRLVTAHRKWHVGSVLAEENSIGNPNIEALRINDGLIVEPFTTTMQSKGQIIRSLALSLERQEDTWIADPVGISELESYESKVSKVTGHISYSAPDGIHDDTVMARALAKAAAERGNVPIFPQAVAFSAMIAVEDDESGEEWSVSAQTYNPYSPTGMRLPGLNYGNH